MLLKMHSTTKLIVFISVSVTLLVISIVEGSSQGGTKGGTSSGRFSQTSSSSSSATKPTSANQQIQLSAGFSATSEPTTSVLNFGDRITHATPSSLSLSSTSSSTSSPGSFLDSLRSKSKLVLNDGSDSNSISTGGNLVQTSSTSSLSSSSNSQQVPNYGGSVPSRQTSSAQVINYQGGSIYRIRPQTRPFIPEEALNLDSSAETTSSENPVVQTNTLGTGSTSVSTSSEEFQNILGTEAPAPLFDTNAPAVTERTSVISNNGLSALTSSSSSSAQQPTRSNLQNQQQLQQQIIQQVPSNQEVEEAEILHPSAKPPQRIQAAVKTKHTFEFRPVVLDDLQEEIEPKIIEVAAKSVPLEIHFKSASSRIKLVQQHKSGELQNVERTSSDEEPQRLVHLVKKPIIQEVREIITPYRRIIQEIQPVMEEIHTIVSHEKERSKTSARGQQQTTTSGRLQAPVQAAQKPQQTSQQQHIQQFVQKIEQQRIPTSWLRPVASNQINNAQGNAQSQTQPKRVERVRITEGSVSRPLQINAQQQQNRVPISYGPSFNTYPLEVTSPSTPTVTPSSEPEVSADDEEISEGSSDGGSEQGSSEQGSGLNDQPSVDVVNSNDISTIIPARLMQEIVHEYQTRNRIMTFRQNQLQQQINQNQNNQGTGGSQSSVSSSSGQQSQSQRGNLQLPVVSQNRVQQQVQQIQNRIQSERAQTIQREQASKGGLGQRELRAAGSQLNWQAVRPYVYYTSGNGQYRGPFTYNMMNSYNNNNNQRF